MSLFGRTKILSPSDYTVCEIGECRESQLIRLADYMETGYATIEWE